MDNNLTELFRLLYKHGEELDNILSMSGSFREQHGIVPNTIILGADHWLARYIEFQEEVLEEIRGTPRVSYLYGMRIIIIKDKYALGLVMETSDDPS